jgi:hypothetical protein
MKKHLPFTISSTKETMAHCDERAKDAGITRSEYLRQLIEEDYVKPKRKLVMMDARTAEKFQEFLKHQESSQ